MLWNALLAQVKNASEIRYGYEQGSRLHTETPTKPAGSFAYNIDHPLREVYY